MTARTRTRLLIALAGLLLILGCLDEPGAAMNLTADDCATARCYR